MSIDDSDNPPRPDDAAQHLQAQVKGDLNQVTDKAKHDLDAVAQRAKDDVSALRGEAEAKAGEVAEKAKSFASDQKDLAAGQISGVASAITKVADELEGSDQATVARYARDLAGGISSMGKTIENHDVDDLMSMAQDFGRKQPLAFLGAAALAGFVASRFALASAHRSSTKVNPTGTGSTGTSSNYGATGSTGSSTSYGSATGGSGSTYGSSTASNQGSATGSTYGSSQYGNNSTGGQ
jgi:hypothetical protein